MECSGIIISVCVLCEQFTSGTSTMEHQGGLRRQLRAGEKGGSGARFRIFYVFWEGSAWRSRRICQYLKICLLFSFTDLASEALNYRNKLPNLAPLLPTTYKKFSRLFQLQWSERSFLLLSDLTTSNQLKIISHPSVAGKLSRYSRSLASS